MYSGEKKKEEKRKEKLHTPNLARVTPRGKTIRRRSIQIGYLVTLTLVVGGIAARRRGYLGEACFGAGGELVGDGFGGGGGGDGCREGQEEGDGCGEAHFR